MKTGRRLIVTTATEVAVLLLLHAALLHWLARKQVVAATLAASDEVPPTWIGLAVLFIAVRLFVLLLLPGLVVQRLLKVGFYFLVERRYIAPEDIGQLTNAGPLPPTKS